MIKTIRLFDSLILVVVIKEMSIMAGVDKGNEDGNDPNEVLLNQRPVQSVGVTKKGSPEDGIPRQKGSNFQSY